MALVLSNPTAGAQGASSTYTHIVAPEGGTHTTLGEALAAAVAGDSIYIKRGTYTEGAITTSLAGLTIIGDSRDSVVLEFGANNMTFSGSSLVLQGVSFTFTTGRPFFSGSYTNINYCTFTKNANGLSSNTYTFQFQAAYSHVSDCRIISNNNFTGTNIQVELRGSSSVYDNNYFQVNALNNGGIYMDSNGRFIYNTVAYNGTSASGNVFVRVDNCTLAYNTISADAPVHVIRSYGGRLIGNAISGGAPNNSPSVGISCQGGLTHVENNTINSAHIGIDVTSGAVRGRFVDNNIVAYGLSWATTGIAVATIGTIITGNHISSYPTGINTSASKHINQGNYLISCTTPVTDTSTSSAVANNMTI